MDDLMKSYNEFQKFIEERFGLKCLNPYSDNQDTAKEFEKELVMMSHIIDDMKLYRKIPENYPCIVNTPPHLLDVHTSVYELRERFIEAGSYSLVSYDWVRKLKETIIKDSKCLEIMAGSGLLSKALKDVGCDIIATDNKSWVDFNRIMFSPWFRDPFTDVEELDCIDAIEKYGKDVDFVIVSWAYMDDTCYRALLKMREVNPDCLMIYIGEYGDCCADENFTQAAESFDIHWFEHMKDGKEPIVENLVEIYNNLVEVRKIYKQWYGIHDDIYIVK